MWAYEFSREGFLVGVNSKNFDSITGHKISPKNVQLIMQKYVIYFDEERLTAFFLATLNNHAY
jgi:hypothetical protein